MKSRRVTVALATIMYLAIGASVAKAVPQVPKAAYWHNWTDSKGVTHLTKCYFHNYDLKTMSKPAGPQWQDRLSEGNATVISTIQPAHWNGIWHEDPKVQWIIPLKGTWFVEAMDGTRVKMGPGEISLGEDQNSIPDAAGKKGHLAGNVGNGPVTLMVVQLSAIPTINQPCHFK
ncbi:MAG: cupin domain-containing protein [Zymomonas mobilis subsp. pomaceae]|uniref:Cupin n=1 Tax=Zymomonas mobilis subsp. pomaceae (strain ATCC 29192 / DSM 22645 / JCM 10191 / CCUG 17912 / NBRC 13757 / NCIMB 11200 / NRRL B-4491 / Barker I) TaxID=579138 RepID=F8EUZ6_ZYMMT|nr:hypothetical protein [Zymomonas mobilis]AEI37284.1 hypothetical protein Zymop_0381 [Zymomonas mobilis subsp. pomaceae ATCC 29192]MDX5948653.1 cupin domain-containing protein [Zymomonas mobilis subsp. pomaceae]